MAQLMPFHVEVPFQSNNLITSDIKNLPYILIEGGSTSCL